MRKLSSSNIHDGVNGAPTYWLIIAAHWHGMPKTRNTSVNHQKLHLGEFSMRFLLWYWYCVLKLVQISFLVHSELVGDGQILRSFSNSALWYHKIRPSLYMWQESSFFFVVQCKLSVSKCTSLCSAEYVFYVTPCILQYTYKSIKEWHVIIQVVAHISIYTSYINLTCFISEILILSFLNN